jgi:predicted DNA-binding protein (MmcQ/YjbR family)
MNREGFLEYCKEIYGTSPDYPFDDMFETAVLRHEDNKKWYALVMKVSRRKFGQKSDEVVDVVNMKLPTEMFGSFGLSDGVHPAYHMNKLHWISVILPDAPDEVVQFLVNVSFEATSDKRKRKSQR